MIRGGDIEMIDTRASLLASEVNFDNPKDVVQFVDGRGFNRLMIAAECGDCDSIQKLLPLGFDVNISIGRYTAASLAFEGQHFEALLLLLNSNSKFPPNFCTPEHRELLDFATLMTSFHECVASGENEKILRILEAKPNLQHFFSLDNVSAPLAAIKSGRLDTYELLVANDIFVAWSENFSDAIKNFDDDEKLKLRQIHEQHAIGFDEAHLSVICGSIFVGHDVAPTERKERLAAAKRAFVYLNTLPMLRQILVLIASARCFKIIFDFNRDHIQFIDPTNDTNTRGAFYLSRHIYIAASRLLDAADCFAAYGTIAHELCHFAMDLVYDNGCSPFEAHNLQRKFQFFFISCDCHSLPGIEPIVDSVFANYSSEHQNAELIVRVPQMVATYSNDPERLKILRAVFHRLFEFYESFVMDDVRKAIPRIGEELSGRCERFLETSQKRVVRWRRICVVCVFVAVLVGFGAFCGFYRENYSWARMSGEERGKMLSGRVKFAGIEVKFSELFNGNQTDFFERLCSQQIEVLVHGKLLDLSENQNRHLQAEIHLVWSNSSEKLRRKAIEGELTFQGRRLPLRDFLLNGSDSKILEKLSSRQLVDFMRNDSELEIASRIQADEFYKERFFVKRRSSEAKNFEDLRREAEEKSLVLLADEAGMGKTTTFRNFAVQLQTSFPLKWTWFAELKNHIGVFARKRSRNLEIVDILSQMLNHTQDSFAGSLFVQLFKQNRVIFLWDGFDEISPDHAEFVLRIFEEIRETSKNQQWISTRPRYAASIEQKLAITRFTLKPYTKHERESFLQLLFESREQNYEKFKSKIDDIIFSIEGGTKQLIVSPLLLHMIANISLDLPANAQIFNLYSIYEEFINQKTRIFLSEKGEIAKNDIQKSLQRDSRIDQVYQHFAIKRLFSNGLYRDYFSHGFEWPTGELDVMQRNFSKFYDAVSRRGILLIESDDEFRFIHRTFAEFYVARYVIEKVCDSDDRIITAEVDRRLNFFFASLQIPKVCDFLLYYPDSCLFRGTFESVLRGKFKQILKVLLSDAAQLEDQILTFSTLPNLLRSQKALLRALWQTDTNQTFLDFYAIAYPQGFVENFPIVKRFEEYIFPSGEVSVGRNQRGNFLVSTLEFRNVGFYDNYSRDYYYKQYLLALNITMSDFEVDKLKNCENFLEIFDLARALLSREELLEIFMRNHRSVFALYLPYIENFAAFWSDFEDAFSPAEIERILLNSIDENLIALSLAFELSSSYFGEVAQLYRQHIAESARDEFFAKFFTEFGERQYLSFIFNYKAIDEEKLADFLELIGEKFDEGQREKILRARVKEMGRRESDNLLFSALGTTHAAAFRRVLRAYTETFGEDEMRKISLEYFKETRHAHNFLFAYSHFHSYACVDAFEVFVEYLDGLFSGKSQPLEAAVRAFVEHVKHSYASEEDKYAEYFVQFFENLLVKIRQK